MVQFIASKTIIRHKDVKQQLYTKTRSIQKESHKRNENEEADDKNLTNFEKLTISIPLNHRKIWKNNNFQTTLLCSDRSILLHYMSSD